MGDNRQTLIRKLRTKTAEALNEKTRQSLSQAVDALQRFLGDSRITAEDLNDSLLLDFLLDMLMQGLTRSTISLYIRNLSALWGKIARNNAHESTSENAPESSRENAPESAGADCPLDPQLFSRLKQPLEELSDNRIALLADLQLAAKLQTLSKAELCANPELQLGRDILLLAIYAGGLDFSRIVRLKKENLPQIVAENKEKEDAEEQENTDTQEIKKIISRCLRPRSPYIFPLRQSERTDAALLREALRLADKTLRIVGIKLPAPISADIAAEISSAIAIRAGIAAADESEKRRQIASLIARDPKNWYAMQFRPGVSYTRLQARLRAHGITLQEEYYPMQEIAKRVGKRIVNKSRPVVPGLLFFRSRPIELRELYYRIGDLAWGYRVSRALNSPYAAISDAAIATYQQTIGTFTADTRLRPAGSVKLNPGDKVLILGGDFVGRTAEYLRDVTLLQRNAAKPSSTAAKASKSDSGASAEETATGRLICRLKLIGENAIEWEINLDPRLISAL